MVTLKFLLKLASSGPHREFLLPAFFRVCFLSVFFFLVILFCFLQKCMQFLLETRHFQLQIPSPPISGACYYFLAYLFSNWLDYFSEVYLYLSPYSGNLRYFPSEGATLGMLTITWDNLVLAGFSFTFSFPDHTELLNSTNFQLIIVFNNVLGHKFLYRPIQSNLGFFGMIVSEVSA